MALDSIVPKKLKICLPIDDEEAPASNSSPPQTYLKISSLALSSLIFVIIEFPSIFIQLKAASDAHRIILMEREEDGKMSTSRYDQVHHLDTTKNRQAVPSGRSRSIVVRSGWCIIGGDHTYHVPQEGCSRLSSPPIVQLSVGVVVYRLSSQHKILCHTFHHPKAIISFTTLL